MTLESNLKKLYLFSALKMALFPMAIITLFWKDQAGLTLTEILLLQGLFSLATLALEFPSGYISDRLGYSFTLKLASILGLVGWALYLPADSFADVLIAEIFLGASFAFISGADSALLFETLRARGLSSRYSQYDGKMTAFAQSGEAVGALFAGTLYAVWPLFPFAVQIVVWAAALILCYQLVEPERSMDRSARTHWTEAKETLHLTFLGNRRIRLTILFSVLLGLASFYPVWLIQPYMQAHQVPLTWFGPIWAFANLTVALFSWLSHRIHFFFGNGVSVILWIFLTLAGYLGLGLMAGQWTFMFYFLLTATRGLQAPVLRHILQQECPSNRRASILSLKSLSFRLAFVASGPLLGWTADRLGLEKALLLTAMALGIPLLISGACFYAATHPSPDKIK